MLIIRKATANDSRRIYELHIASIRHYCSSYYSIYAIIAWTSVKSLADYDKFVQNDIVIVAEDNDQRIKGFALLNPRKQSLDSLYIAPGHAGEGCGKMLLNSIEKAAKDQKIEKITLFSTVNAFEFYKHMG